MALPIAMHQEPCALSLRQVAERLGVSASTFQRLVTSKSRVTPDMALRLSAVLGRSPESWLALQDSYDLWQARQRLDLREAAKVALRQLNRCCGPLSEATTARIQALPLEQLEALAEALLDFRGPKDLVAWLAANA